MFKMLGGFFGIEYVLNIYLFFKLGIIFRFMIDIKLSRME